MDDQVKRLVDKVWRRYRALPADQRLMICIGGMPGSGKTSLAHAVVAGVNRLQAEAEAAEAAETAETVEAAREPSREPVAVAVPMDGFHLTRAQLSAMPDPARAHARRGAEFTFDGAGYLALVEAVRAQARPTDVPVLCPAFDHAAKDPVADAIAVGPRQRVVVFEGNYVCLDREPWRTACDAQHMDERWFVTVAGGRAAVRRRLVARHVASGVEADAAAAGRRADENDLVNGAEIEAERVADVDELIVSEEDPSWA